MGQTYTRTALRKMSMTELVTLYNGTGAKRIKKFRDKDTAVERTSVALNNGSIAPASKPPAPPKGSKKKSSKKSEVKRGRRRKLFDLPYLGEIQKHREGTKRDTLVAMLTPGATFEEVMHQFDWNAKTAYEGIKLLNTHLGYGVKESSDGTIKLKKR